MADVAVILGALAALIALAYRGVSLLLLAPALAVLAVALTGDGPVFATYTQVFMRAMGGFVIQYFPLFLLGAVFGKLMAASGSAAALAQAIIARLGARRAILAVILSCAVMTYGGVSLFVVAFAVYPIASALFRAGDLPKVLIPGAIALGAFTFTMTALPGTPAIQNAIPMPYFGTTPFAAPGLGLIAGAVMLLGGWVWLEYRLRRLGPGYGAFDDAATEVPQAARPSLGVAALPLVLVIALNLVFTFAVIPRMDTSYLALPAFGGTDIGQLRGIWSIIAALSLSGVALIALNLGRLRDTLAATLDEGAKDALMPMFNTASLVGFGAVIAAMQAFALIRDWVVGFGGDNPLIGLALSTSLLAGITGSASGGMSIALSTLGPAYMDMAQAMGIDPGLLHRVTAVATGGLDALPHNGAVITLLTICGLSHRQGYGDIAVVAVVIPIVALIVLVVLGTAFGSF